MTTALEPKHAGRPRLGIERPRIAPPTPLHHRLAEYEQAASDMGLELMGWQKYTGKFLTGIGPKDQWLYPEVCVVCARQNGKTTLLLPRILMELRAGKDVLHTAQSRAIPRETFEMLADKLGGSKEVAKRGIRWANGQESIKFANGGTYRLVAPLHGIRGYHADLVIQDEVREQRSERLRAAMIPTLVAAPNPQTIYLSNAGDDESVVLNSLRRRKDDKGPLAYLEWSAAPELTLDDPLGWAQANPALGRTVSIDGLRNLRQSLAASTFETEHLCRWVATMRERLVDEYAWSLCKVDDLGDAKRPFMGISMDPSGTRASVAIAWQQGDNIALRLLFEGTGSPIEPDKFGKDILESVLRLGVPKVGYDPMTDAALAKFLKVSEPISGAKFANASARFELAVRSRHLNWDDAQQITDDLTWTARKPHESGSYQAVRANDSRPITAALASIRAVWLASGQKPDLPKVM